ncbi:MAG: histidine kinase [Xylanivirga thermophila]|jgi:two-component system, sensor histidine kinase YesM|uniref:sensor histidine kinase n=1 Tax=Xylanivirga thermophila TaxID=2496273 RepID=UPI0039F59DD9
MNQFTNLKIKAQFKIILICIIIACLGIGMFTFFAVKNLLVKNAATYSQNISQKFNSEIDYLFSKVNSIYDYLQFNQNIEQIFLKPYTENTPTNIRNILVQFTSYSMMNKDISDIAMVNKDIHWSSLYSAETLNSMTTELGKSYHMKSLGIKNTELKNNNAPEGPYLVFAKNIFGVHDNANYGKLLGSIILSIDPKKSSINLPNSEDSQAYFILVDKGAHTYPFNCSDTFCKEILSQCGNLKKFISPAPTQEDTKDYLLFVSYVPSAEYYVICALDKHELNSDLVKVTSMVLLIVLVVLFFILFLMWNIQHNMVDPINELYLHIKRIRKITPDGPKPVINLYGCEEIHSLSQEFNNMVQETDRLNNELYEATVNLYEAKLGKKQAELDYLRSQINPHFLYNALESIKNIGLEQNVPEIASIATALAKMFRYNVKGESTVLFAEELEITQAYLDIQLARFPDKFDVIYSIRENTLNVPVMKLLLQPLVENAISHGIESMTRRGTIYIGARLDQNDLVITIQDDGIGIDSKTLEDIKTHLENPDMSQKNKEHIGIINVHYRIQLHYGKAYGLSIESSKDSGTKVVLKFPKTISNTHNMEEIKCLRY